MKTLYKQLKMAADTLDAQAALFEKAAESVDAASAAAKAAQSTVTKTASAVEMTKATLAPLAKTAATAVRQAGLLSSQEQEDVFASQLLNHKEALSKLAQLSKYVGIPKRASVVTDPQAADETADQRWDKTALHALQTLNIPC